MMDFMTEGSGAAPAADGVSQQSAAAATAANDAALASAAYYWNNGAPAPASTTAAAAPSATNAFDAFLAQSFQFTTAETPGAPDNNASGAAPQQQPQQPQHIYYVAAPQGQQVPAQQQQQVVQQQQPPVPGQQVQQQQQQPPQYQYVQQPTPQEPPVAAPAGSVAIAPGQQPATYYTTGPAPAPAAGAPPSGARTLVQQMPDGSYAILGHATATGVPHQQYTAVPQATSATTAPPGGNVFAGVGIVPSTVPSSATPGLPAPPTVPPFLAAPTRTKKEKPPAKAIPGNLTPEERQRYERNLREQQRSFQISSQIKELRSVLLAANIPLNSNKYSILLAAGEYIKQLQTRAIMNEAEHRKLVNTLQQVNDYVQNPELLPEPDKPESSLSQQDAADKEDMKLFVQGLDYKAVVDQCSAALGVAALDGRFLECNNEFALISGFTREQLKSQTLFTLLQNQQEVFEALGEMLKSTAAAAASASMETQSLETPRQPLHWSGLVTGRSNPELTMNITLARSSDGKPRFFNCALAAST